MEKNLFLILCLSAVLLSLATHSIVLAEFVMPTYGNTMIHVATARHLVEKGVYPLEDYSYGGGIPNTYVPLYRVSLALVKAGTGLDYDAAGRLLVLLFAAMVPIGFILAARELFGDWPGIAAGLLVSTLPEYLIYTVRPLPQAMGLALLPFFIFLVARKKLWASVALAVVISLAHQEAGAFLVACAFAFFCFDVAKNYLEKKRLEAGEAARISLASWFFGTAAYFGWHFFTAGNLNILGLAQFVNHEGAVVTEKLLLDKTGILAVVFAVAAILLLAEKMLKRQSLSEGEVIALSWLAVGLFAIKNELFGLGVFMDRFIVYLQIPLVLLSAFAAYAVAEKLWKSKAVEW
jgi:hypothetical protein